MKTDLGRENSGNFVTIRQFFRQMINLFAKIERNAENENASGNTDSRKRPISLKTLSSENLSFK